MFLLHSHGFKKKKSVSRSLNLQVILGFLRLHLKSGLSTELKVFDLQLRSEHMLVCKAVCSSGTNEDLDVGSTLPRKCPYKWV